MNRVLVAGSVNMDVVVTADRHPSIGETIPGRELHFFPGGKGANQAVAAAKLGVETFMIAKIGRDGFADELADFLKSQDVKMNYVDRTTGAATGTALIVVAETGENTIVVVPGANGLLGRSAIEQINFQAGDILISQFEIPLETIEFFFAKGKAANATTILNPAPVRPGGERLLKIPDILVVNETELASFLGSKQPDDGSLASAARSLRASPAQAIIVTLGANGAFMLDGEEQYRVPGRRVQAVDTTGAGDCFVGALGSQLAKNAALKQAVAYANAAASICVQRMGAGTSMPTSDEVRQVLVES